MPSYYPTRDSKLLSLIAGTEFVLKKTIVSSTILTASATDVTAVSTIGELLLMDCVVKTDATGLAGGTNFQLLTNNANGLANFFVETIANLGANKSIDMNGASVTKIRTVIEVGKKIQVQNSVGNGTGAGIITVYFRFMRITDGASIT